MCHTLAAREALYHPPACHPPLLPRPGLQAEKLVHKMDRRGLVQGELGLALFKISKFEETEGLPLAQHTGTIRQSQVSHIHHS